MRFTKKFLAELPFILNVPAGDYSIRMPDGVRILQVHHDLYAGSPGAFTYGAPIAVGAKDRLPRAFPDGAPLSLHHLRTVVQRIASCESGLDDVTEAQAIDEVAGRIIRERVEHGAGEALLQAAGLRFHALPVEEQAEVYRIKALKLTGRRLFREQSSEQFLEILNTFIRHYMISVTDFFAEEVALHQVAGTTVGGIQESYYCDGEFIESVTTVGKIPPVMRQPWFDHGAEKISALRTALETGAAPDAVALLGIRARALLERGAHRSAIIEAAAGLETAVARRLLAALVAKGLSADAARETLGQEQRFSDRCKQLFKEYVGYSLADRDAALWSRVAGHRDRLRNHIVHSDADPSAKESLVVVEDFLALAALAQATAP